MFLYMSTYPSVLNCLQHTPLLWHTDVQVSHTIYRSLTFHYFRLFKVKPKFLYIFCFTYYVSGVYNYRATPGRSLEFCVQSKCAILSPLMEQCNESSIWFSYLANLQKQIVFCSFLLHGEGELNQSLDQDPLIRFLIYKLTYSYENVCISLITAKMLKITLLFIRYLMQMVMQYNFTE